MRIRAIEVRNWACIESLSLTDLRDGVIVLHGPNRTGKSSLVQAIRSAVFDHLHDSQDSPLTAAIPWKSKAVPQVVVEFEHAGGRYRISKTFAKTKEGQAVLEQQSTTGWTVVIKGKDASKKVRELIGAEKSTSGVFQMLWLGQRDFQLPPPSKLDSRLQESLESVLGTLITGRDIDFKERLDTACERWFTVKTMQDKKASPVTKLDTERQAAIARKKEVDQQWADAESALREYDEALARQPDLRRGVDEAVEEMKRLQTECEVIWQRRSQYELAVKSFGQCEQLFLQAEQRLGEYDQTAKTLEASSNLLDSLGYERRAAQDRREAAEAAASKARQAADEADGELTAHRHNRKPLEDRQLAINNHLARQSIEERIQQAKELDAKRCDLEQKLAGATALTNERLGELRADREKAAGLRARLEAAEIHVSVRLRQPMNVQIAKDGEAIHRGELTESQDGTWLIRQYAEMQIGDLATIRIGRGAEDRDLETLVADLARIESALRDALVFAQVDPNEATAIEQLATRRLHFDEYTEQLNKVRQSIAKAMPIGLPALCVEFEQKQAERDDILARRPEFVDWHPDQGEMDRLRLEFTNREDKLQALAQQTKQYLEGANDTLSQAKTTEGDMLTSIATQQAKLQTLKEAIEKIDRSSLVLQLEQACASLAEAKKKVAESTLTEKEQAVETQFESARSAHASRDERARTNENLLAELRGKLAGTEGLHQRRIQADQVVHDVTNEHDRESYFASAHKHLKKMFEQVHQEEVQRTVGPISERVMLWAKHLGLTDIANLSFGNQLLPAGFVPSHAAEGDSVDLDRESFGTLEQLSLLIRLAVGGLLSRTESAVAILDDPLAHADPGKHRKMLDILDRAARGEAHGPHPTGALQIIILTCHADRFDYLQAAQQLDLASLIHRSS